MTKPDNDILVYGPDNQYRGGEAFGTHAIDATRLADNLQALLKKFGDGLAQHPLSYPGGRIKELELNLGVSLDGKVSLLGTGVGAGATASLKVKIEFGRKD